MKLRQQQSRIVGPHDVVRVIRQEGSASMHGAHHGRLAGLLDAYFAGQRSARDTALDIRATLHTQGGGGFDLIEEPGLPPQARWMIRALKDEMAR